MFRDRLLAVLSGACLIFSAAGQSPAGRSVRLAWDPNPENDLAGYRLHRGNHPGTRVATRDVGNVTTSDWSGLLEGSTNYFTVTAYNTAGLESGPSNELMYIAGPDLPLIAGFEPSSSVFIPGQ